MALSAGSRLGPYEVIAPLGAGGMGEVYRVRDSRIGRDAALKILPEVASADEARIRRFEQEARSAGVLNHPNLLVVYDVGTDGGIHFLVTELLEGETLREKLSSRVPPRQALAWASCVAAGVAAAHEKGIAHRDLKPENIFITDDDRVKILDFGLAKLFADPFTDPSQSTALKQTDPGVAVGTPGYMSPEQLRAAAVDERTDIFSLGIVLAEMISGHPFRGESSAVTNSAILGADPRIGEDVAPDVVRVLLHMLEKQPGRRFQTMKDVVFALDLLLAGSSTSGPRSRQSGAGEAAEEPSEITYRRLTFRRGFVLNARFAPDGSVVYGAMWDDDDQFDVYGCVPGNPESRRLGVPGADLLSVSPSGELALSLGRRITAGWAFIGTLGRRPLVGGSPRQVAERIQEAEWSRDGKSLAVIRVVDDGFTVEYPMGRILRRIDTWASHLRISPDGQRLAFIEHPFWGDDGGRVRVIDTEGNILLEGRTNYASAAGVAWSPDGSEVWLAGERKGRGREIVGISTRGVERTVLSVPSRSTLYDVSPKGELLMSMDSTIREIIAGHRGGAARQLNWFDWSFPTDISPDGSKILFEEQGLARPGDRYAIYERATDGSPAVYLGDGRGRTYSPDGRWIVADAEAEDELEIIPAGVGELRRIRLDRPLHLTWWYWPNPDDRLYLWGNDSGRAPRVWETTLAGGAAIPLTPEGTKWPIAFSPDGARLCGGWTDGVPRMFERGSDALREIPGCVKGDRVFRWSGDGRYLYLAGRGRRSVPIDRLDLSSGTREHWVTLQPLDPAGVLDVMPIIFSADGESYAFGYRRLLSELYVVGGVR